MVVFPHGTAPRTAVIPVGEPDPDACEAVAETLRETFEFPVPIRQPIDAPLEDGEGDEDDENGRDAADGERLLEFLRRETDGVDLVVGVTDRPVALRSEGVPLFGVGLEFGTVGVVSTARLLEGSSLSALERERLGKEALSVVGTMLGLRTRLHEDDDGDPCVVAPGDARFELDRAPDTYCEDCRSALTGESATLEPPAPDDWVVRPRGASPADRDGLRWWEYPLVPIGLVVVAVTEFVARLGPIVGRLPGPGIESVRDLPQPVHTVYRIVSFWTNVALYLGAILCWLIAIVSVHDRFVGSEFSDAGIVGLLLAGLLLGAFTALLIKGIVGGIVDGLRLAAEESKWE